MTDKFKEFKSVRVLGFPSLTDGEFIIAAVEIPKKGFVFHEDFYMEELHKVLPALKVPSHIIYMSKFPRVANGKLDERRLREICIDRLERYIDHKLAREARKIQKQLGKG